MNGYLQSNLVPLQVAYPVTSDSLMGLKPITLASRQNELTINPLSYWDVPEPNVYGSEAMSKLFDGIAKAIKDNSDSENSSSSGNKSNDLFSIVSLLAQSGALA